MTDCITPAKLYNQPYYTHPCDDLVEDHARHVLLHQYVACVKIPSQWSVPTDMSQVRVDLPAVVDILIGCRMWNPDYGYFLVVAFDKQAQTVTLERTSGSAMPGTVVPMCTKFIFTPNV